MFLTSINRQAVRGGLRDYARAISDIMQKKKNHSGLIFREGDFNSLHLNAQQWAGATDPEARVVTFDVMVEIARDPSMREGLGMGFVQTYKNYFTEGTADSAMKCYNVIKQGLNHDPGAVKRGAFGRRKGKPPPLFLS